MITEFILMILMFVLAFVFLVFESSSRLFESTKPGTILVFKFCVTRLASILRISSLSVNCWLFIRVCSVILRIMSLWSELWACLVFWLSELYLEWTLNFYPIYCCLFRTLLISSVGRINSSGPRYSVRNWITFLAQLNLPSISNPIKSSRRFCCHFSTYNLKVSKSWIKTSLPLNLIPVKGRL